MHEKNRTMGIGSLAEHKQNIFNGHLYITSHCDKEFYVTY